MLRNIISANRNLSRSLLLAQSRTNLLNKRLSSCNLLVRRNQQQIRKFSSSAILFNNDDNSNNNNNNVKNEADDFIVEQQQPNNNNNNNNNVPATQIVPEIYPIVPLIPVNRNPLFPKFVKMVEISDEKLVKMLRTKVRLNRPYVGVFVKKQDSDEAEVIQDLDRLYKVGTFSQIVEMQDLGNRLRMVILGHRRIQLKAALPYEEDLDDEAVKDEGFAELEQQQQQQQQQQQSKDILMLDTENVDKEKYESTDELKALTQEVIKTIRDIMALNPLYRESLQQMLQIGQRIVDNPVYLSDLGAALTAGDTQDLQVYIQSAAKNSHCSLVTCTV